MWKPWILIALGSVLATQAVARALVPVDVMEAYNAQHETSSSALSAICASEV